MSDQLEGLQYYHPLWTSHIGCIKACLDYLDRDVSSAWLFGGTSHAFVLNIHGELCLSGPTAWQSEAIHRLAANLGFQTPGVVGFRGEPRFADRQAEAWDHVRRNLDAGTPCYAWNLQQAEFDVIRGYDDVGYHFSGPDCVDGAGPKPWREVGTDEIGVLEVYSVEPCEPAPDGKTVRDALATAVAYARTPEKWAVEGRTFGPQAFETWATALETGSASRFGLGYNGAVWAECRREAVAFLREATRRLPRAAPLLREGSAHFETVRDRLAALSERYPFRPDSGPDVSIRDADTAALLREAKGAELSGLAALERVLVDSV